MIWAVLSSGIEGLPLGGGADVSWWQTVGSLAAVFGLLLLFLRQSWVPRVFQVLLVLGALEWLHTLYAFARIRIALEQPWTRLAVILGAVALFTGLSALVFRSRALKFLYRTDERNEP